MSGIRILVTGFEPFGGELINPSKELVRMLAGIAQVETLVLPVSFDHAFNLLRAKAALEKFDFILMLGQAGGRRAIGLERIAINLIDTEVGDEEGVRFANHKISPKGPEAIISRLPLGKWVSQIKALGVPCEISNTAGLFVCNHLYFQVEEWLRNERPTTSSLFVHLPYLIEQTISKAEHTPALSAAAMFEALAKLIELVKVSAVP